MGEVTHAYIGRCRGCEAVLAMCVDDPSDAKLAAEFLAENAEAGLAMSRVTLEEAIAAWSATWKDNVGCKCAKPPAPASGSGEEVWRGE